MLNKKLIENYIINNENKVKINSNEIANGDWVVQDTSIDFIFNAPEKKMWSTAIESFGIDVSNLSSYSGKA